MARAIGLVVALVSLACAPLFATDENPSPGEMIPGFSSLRWKDVARIELVEGQESTSRAGVPPTIEQVSQVLLYRNREGRRRPLAIAPDALSTASGSTSDRLKSRGEQWRVLVVSHNPLIKLEAIHRDVEIVRPFFGEPRIREDVKQRNVLHEPTEAEVRAALASDVDAINRKLGEFSRNKETAAKWYYIANCLLIFAAIMVLAIVIFPALRQRNNASSTPAPGTDS